MTVRLTHHAYGKSQVRLTHVTRRPGGHDLKELTVSIQLEGDFAASYLEGDNSRVVATDTMKNLVYILAREQGVRDPETFGQALAGRFLQEYAQVSRAAIELEEHLWERLAPHAFLGGGSETRRCWISADRDAMRVESGLVGLLVLKTTDSAFAGFVRDRYTTLPETSDRILATMVSATWSCAAAPTDWNASHCRVREALLETFAGHHSLSVQQTLFAMGAAVLERCAEVAEVRLEMPNKHRILVNLQPFGLDNNNEVFMAVDEPYGLISGTVRR